MNFFEKLLEKKCKEEGTQYYQIQWGYDKKLYSSILSAVNESYPSYTDHGKSHSDSILNNILKMFGEEILNDLSSLDVWLLLEATYLHDCGMFISLERAQKIIEEDGFINFIKNIHYNSKDSLYKYAVQFSLEEGGIKYKNLNYTPKKELAMKYLISSYKRNNHAFELQETTKKRGDKLLPIRLYKVLDLICESHCWHFEELDKLPQKESGIINEIGHPRFISYLLRIGDLLDIDNNRMDYIQTRDLEKDIPIDSKLHVDKHLSIIHFRIDSERIEISSLVDCGLTSYEVAEITNLWFEYLQKEYSNQLHSWKDVVPSNFLGTLPTLGTLKTEIKDYEYIDPKYKPKFSINLEDISELLMGDSIYKNKETAIRELIQNSIDATYLKLFEEKKDTNDLNKPLSQNEKKDYFKGKEIKILIDKKFDKCTDKFNCWEITIKDSGVGISKNTLKYILNTGSSSKNYQKKNIIEQMPYWLRPSGNFGIGFQSIFMLTEEVHIKSKDLYTNDEIDVILFKPSKKNQVYFKKTSFNYNKKIGTEIKFNYYTTKISQSFRYEETFSKKVVEEFDALIDNEFDTEIINIIDMINKVNLYSLIDIDVTKDGIPLELDKKLLTNIKCKSNEKFEIELLSCGEFGSGSMNALYFKNQFIEDKKSIGLKFLNFKINIIGFKAKDIMEINRNSLKSSFYNKEILELKSSIFKYIFENYLKKSVEDVENEILMFYLYYKNLFEEYKILLSKEKIQSIKERVFDIEISKNCSINDIMRNKEIEIENVKQEYGASFVKILPNNKDINTYQLDFILSIILEENKYFIQTKENNDAIKLIKVDNYENEKIDIEYETQIKNILKLQKISMFSLKLGRIFLCYNGNFLKLKLKKHLEKTEVEQWIYYDSYTGGYLSFAHELRSFINRNLILCPFFMRTKNILIYNELIREKYINFCFKNRLDENTTKEEITFEVDELVESLKEKFKNDGIEIKSK